MMKRISSLIILLGFFVLKSHAETPDCSIDLVESIPLNLTYPKGSPTHLSTFEAWKWLINSTRKNLNIISFYWSLQSKDVMNRTIPSANEGEHILASLYNSSKNEKFKLNIIVNGKKNLNNSDLSLLSKANFTTIRWLDVVRFFGKGIIHTKQWTSDGLHAYVGSANMDFRSLTQVKELGVLIRNCPKIVTNMDKIFAANYYLAKPNVLPRYWPKELSPKFNSTHPLQWNNHGAVMNISISSSPVEFNPDSRDNDITSIIRIIKSAKKFIYISVMDYLPLILSYGKHHQSFPYWGEIDNALREAATQRNVNVRLLISHWKSTRPAIKGFLLSLAALSVINNTRLETKFFIVPAYNKEQKSIPYCRVNHNKYMVTDSTAYIGTSNWSGDYFLYTGGVGFAAVDAQNKSSSYSLRSQAEAVFLRDWYSKYTYPIKMFQ